MLSLISLICKQCQIINGSDIDVISKRECKQTSVCYENTPLFPWFDAWIGGIACNKNVATVAKSTAWWVRKSQQRKFITNWRKTLKLIIWYGTTWKKEACF